MLGRLFGRKRREPERFDPWETLVEASAPAAKEADQLIGNAVRKVAPELGVSVEEVVLDARQWERAFETVISEIENYLEELCGRYDYRQLLFFSRLCAGLPWFRSTERPEEARMRARSADRWVLRCGNRSLEHDYMRIDEGGYSLGHLPDSISYDAVLIHVLAKLHARMVKEHMVFNFMRLASSKNGWRPGPRIRFTADVRIGWKFGTAHLQAAANLFVFRYDSYSSTLARWGMDEFHTQEQPLALAYELNEEFTNEPYGGGTLFIPRPLWLDAVLEYGSTFSALFVRDVGMPVEHLWAICRGLGRLSIETAAADEARLANWGGYSATLPVAREKLLGGALEEEARRELGELFPDFRASQSLSESVTRFVNLASSASRGAVSRGGRQRTAEETRTLVYPFMIHGESNHELWIVDYFMTRSFFQALVSQLEFSNSKSTTGLRDSDVSTRTSIFDAHLAEMLCEVPGVEKAFREHREHPDLPNAKFYFDGGAQDREIDVPLRFGEVLLAVQTWAPEVDLRIDAGDYKAMKSRWKKVKDKLGKTDQRYTDYLLRHFERRRCMDKEGLRYVLPVVCGPYAEPAVSFEPNFWLRYPSYDAGGRIQAPAVPRVLTPIELVYFLATTTEQELKEICETNKWKLVP